MSTSAPRLIAAFMLSTLGLGLVPPAAMASTTSSWTSPEGTTIVIDSAGPWSTEQIYRMLLENGLDASLGGSLTVRVQDVYASQTTASAVMSAGVYTSYRSTMYLKGIDSNFALHPDAILAHELGHAWTMRSLYLVQQGDWTAYLSFRELLDEPLVDSSYSWSRYEMIADDYRLVMGSDLARSEMPGYINSAAPSPSSFPGFEDFFRVTWAGGTAGPTPSSTPVATAMPTPTVSPTATPAATPSPTPAPTATPVPTPSPTPALEPETLVTSLAASPAMVKRSTTVSFAISADARISVTIVDGKGVVVRTLLTAADASGKEAVTWDRTDANGRRVPTGAYRVVVSAVAAVSDTDDLALTVK